MGYNPQNAKQEELLKPDTVYNGLIVAIREGKIKDFVHSIEKWKNPDGQAIEVTIEVMANGKAIRFDRLFSYREDNGQTVYTTKSDLGKFKAKYGRLPMPGVPVKAIADKDGFLRLMLE